MLEQGTLVPLRMLHKRVSSLIRVLVEGVAFVEHFSSFPREIVAREITLRLWPGQNAGWQRP